MGGSGTVRRLDDGPARLHDGLIPNNLGGSSNEDRIIVGKFDDALLWQSQTRLTAHPDALASSLGIRLPAYRYLAFTAGPYPKGFAVAKGSGQVVTTVLSGY